jgi:hypothetical protein
MKDFIESWISNFVSTNETRILNLSADSEYNSPFNFYNQEFDFRKNQNSMLFPSFENNQNNLSGISEFKNSSNIYNTKFDFGNQNISDFALKFDTELNNISGNIENNIPTNKNVAIDYTINSNKNLFQKSKEKILEDEKVQDKLIIPEISLLKKKKNNSSKLEGQFSNLEERKESHTKSRNIRKKELQELRQIKFKVTHSPNYSRSGNNTKKISYRSSNCKNKIIRNLFQNIFIDWLSRSNNPKLTKLSKYYLEVIYIKYKDYKNVKLGEIYSGDCFEKKSGKDREFFEENRKAIKASSVSMRSKLNFTFQQAFNSFYNKTNILSKDGDILSGLKSKDEYIKEHNKNDEQNVKELFEKNMENLFNSLNDEKA